MDRNIRLTEPVGNGTRNLRLFAGRSLGEQEFDLMQTYVAEKCEDLLAGYRPGILWGLQLISDGVGPEAQLSVQPGLALGGDGRAIRAHSPIVLDWPSVREEFKTRTRAPDTPDTALSGWYYLTVKRETSIIDPPGNPKPCSRTELDILRDSRLETLATLDLQQVSAAPQFMTIPATRAINQLGVRALSDLTFNAQTGAVPLALVKIVDDEIAVEAGKLVLDAVAGRYMAVPDTAHLSFLNRWIEEVEARSNRRFLRHQPIRKTPTPTGNLASINPILRPGLNFPGLSRATRLLSHRVKLFDPRIQFDPALPLSEQLGVDYLPAAGPLPDGLVLQIAGRPSGEGWSNPELRFAPLDLQIEIAPIRASQIEEVISREMPRGVVDLVNTQGDRIRFLVAVDDHDYSATLMDLPETDALLNDAVYIRLQEARSLWQKWAEAYVELFGRLSSNVLTLDGTPTEEALILFRGIRIPQPPAGAFADIENAESSNAGTARKLLGISRPIAPPPRGKHYFSGLIGRRREKAKASGLSFPRPYAQGIPDEPENLQPDGFTGLPEPADGMYRRREVLLREIELLEEELDSNDRLVADYDVFIRAQRQQVDSITVSFTALAGGIPGDGSGLQLAKWAPFTELAEAPTTAVE